MARRYVVLALALVLAAGGCGKEVVVGGQKDVDTYATGDGTPEGGSPSRAPSHSLTPGDGPMATHIAGRAQGTVTFDAKVTLRTTGGEESALTTTPRTATVRIDGHDSTLVVSASVPEGRYTVARVVFTRVQANVTSGLVIGGINVTGLVNVAIADSVVVERTVDLGGSTDDAELLIDLDASAWLGTANPVTRVVAAATFQGAVKLRRMD
jgi:hypothetical protein